MQVGDGRQERVRPVGDRNARSALGGAPEALSMVSRGLVARSASYPR